MKYYRWICLWVYSAAMILSAGEVTFVTPMKIDLGEVESGRIIEGVIQFVNTGKDSLKIEQVRTSCGCTAVETQKKIYAPKDTASVYFKLKTRGFKGKIRKSVTIQFENRDLPAKTVQLVANCLNYLEFDPRYLTFTQIKVNGDTLIERYIRVISHYKEPIQIQSVYTDIQSLKIDFGKRMLDSGESCIFKVTLKPDRALRKSSRIWIETDNPKIEPLHMPVYVNIQE